MKSKIGGVLVFQQTDDLGEYLGVSLFHTCTKKCTFQFIVDKVRQKLNGYNAKLLSLAGRVMLAKSVVLTIPGYFMQTAMLPIGVCERIEQVVRRFVWGGSSDVAKTTLVNWENCCQPLLKGGL